MIARAPERWRTRVPVVLALLALVAAIFGQAVTFEFLPSYDDDRYVLGNRHIRAGVTMEGLRWALTAFHASNWHPLTWLSHMLDVQLFGLRPGGHHLVSVLFHGVNAVLVFRLFASLTGAPWRSALVAALFAAHPLHVESVAWVSERKDVLAAFFFLLALLAYLRHVRRPSTASYLGTALLYSLGLAAKPMLVTFPLILLLLDFWPLGRFRDPAGGRSRVGRALLEKVPLLIPTAASVLVTLAAQRRGGALLSFDDIPAAPRLANALVSYVAYVGKTIWPHPLSFIYPYPVEGIAAWRTAAAAAGLALATGAVLAQRGRRPWLAAGWLWYLLALVPVIGLIQVGPQALADRYTYLPLLGLFAAAAWSPRGGRKRGRRGAAAGAAALLVLALATVSWFQARHWRSNLELFRHAVEVSSDNWIAQNYLGLLLARSGRSREAAGHYAAALRINPDYDEACVNLAQALAGVGKLGEAVGLYRRAIAINPRQEQAYLSLGMTLARLGAAAEAERCYREALHLNPSLRPVVEGLLGPGHSPEF